MKGKNLIDKFTQSSPGIQLAIIGLIVIWTLTFVLIIFGIFFVSLERPSQAAGIMLTPLTPAIMVEPSTGSVGTLVTVQGQGRPAGSDTRTKPNYILVTGSPSSTPTMTPTPTPTETPVPPTATPTNTPTLTPIPVIP